MKSSALAPLAVLALIVLAVGIGAHISHAAMTVSAPQHYQEYRNDRWHFSVFIPDSWKVAAADVPGGQTLTFLDPAGKDQFEISAWPYADLDIHATRLQSA